MTGTMIGNLDARAKYHNVTVGCCFSKRIIAVPYDAVFTAVLLGIDVQGTIARWGSQDALAAEAVRSAGGALHREFLPPTGRSELTNSWGNRVIPFDPYEARHKNQRAMHLPAFITNLESSDFEAYALFLNSISV